jgi:hypothetical protein
MKRASVPAHEALAEDDDVVEALGHALHSVLEELAVDHRHPRCKAGSLAVRRRHEKSDQ